MSSARMIGRAVASRRLSGKGLRPKSVDLLTVLTRNTYTNLRTMASKAITMENINPNIVKLEYAVRGPLVTRAGEIEKELQKVITYIYFN